MRCKACNTPFYGSGRGKMGDLCPKCRAAIYKDLADDFPDTEDRPNEHTQTNTGDYPVNIDSPESLEDSDSINPNGYFYDFFDNF